MVYLDPDILLFRPMAEVFDGLVAHNIVLIPHIMQPLQDDKEPSDHTIMKSGVYNLGFLGVRNDPYSRTLIDWWSERCYLHCRVDVPGHMFTDQRWMDLAPAFVPDRGDARRALRDRAHDAPGRPRPRAGAALDPPPARLRGDAVRQGLVATAAAAAAFAVLAALVVAGAATGLDQHAVDEWMPGLDPHTRPSPVLSWHQFHPRVEGALETAGNVWTYPARRSSPVSCSRCAASCSCDAGAALRRRRGSRAGSE